jgi:hypothetical protein
VADEPFALVFDAHGTMLRISKLPDHVPPPFTVLGWSVPDISADVSSLTANGVTFQFYSDLKQDKKGICTFADGTRVAWFKDPDGNTLSLTQFP